MQHFWVILLYLTWIGAVPSTEEQVSGKELYSKGLEPRITNGRKAKLGQFPWQAGIITKDNLCGGSLINDQWILTAAHCLESLEVDEIFLGSTHFFKKHNRKDRYRRKYLASKICLHPRYDPVQVINDIALIKLQTPVKVNDYIQPIKLANKRLPSGSKVVASGWGDTHNGTTNNLLFAHLITLPTDKCKKYPKLWEPKTICVIGVGVKHENICEGDSGGPLIFCDDDDPDCRKREKSNGTAPFLVGITSYGPDNTPCESNEYPQYFTDVYEFRDWISTTMEDDSIKFCTDIETLTET